MFGEMGESGRGSGLWMNIMILSKHTINHQPSRFTFTRSVSCPWKGCTCFLTLHVDLWAHGLLAFFFKPIYDPPHCNAFLFSRFWAPMDKFGGQISLNSSCIIGHMVVGLDNPHQAPIPQAGAGIRVRHPCKDEQRHYEWFRGPSGWLEDLSL